jgi:hypothetical protein
VLEMLSLPSETWAVWEVMNNPHRGDSTLIGPIV